MGKIKAAIKRAIVKLSDREKVVANERDSFPMYKPTGS